MITDKRISERLRNINPSQTLAITSQAKKLKSQGQDIVSFAVGEPDFDTSEFVKSAAIKAIKSGFTKYTPTTGIPELKQAIIEKFKNDNSLEYSPGQVIVSCGAKHSIYNALMSLVGSDDEVLIPLPYWVSYPEMVNLCGGKPVFIETNPENNFKVTVAELKKKITSRTKALILNSPSNPAGSVFNKDELIQIAELCVAKKIFVISDEIYEKIIFDDLRHISVAALGEDIYNLTITVNGLSKSHSMTGWRIGYLGAPVDIAGAISKLQDHSTSNPASISQKAAVAALSGSADFVKNMAREFEKRRNYAISRLRNIAKLSFIKPEGAFYIFCGIAQTKLGSLRFSQQLLREAQVAVIPGIAFGRDDYIRISFATSMEQLQKGLDRIEGWLNNG